MTSAKRRSPGEGGAYSYQTRAGERWYWKAVITKADGTTKPVVRRGFTTKKAALAAMRKALGESEEGTFTDPSRQRLSAYLDEWLDGLRLQRTSVANYRILMRCHVKPYLGELPLSSLTTARIKALYRRLEREGHRNTKGELDGKGLGPNTVHKVATVLSAALKAAVESGQLRSNPADKADPPTVRQVAAAKRPVHPWTAGQLAAFLGWAKQHSTYHAMWHVLAMTGMRRGEAIALRWRDVDLEQARITVRHSAQVVRYRGESGAVTEGPTKSHKPRVVDIDGATVELLRSWRRIRGLLALQLARDGALVFGDHEGRFKRPEQVSAAFKDNVERARKALGEDVLPALRLHGLRHTHATLLLRDREPVKTVSERLGHASEAITYQVYGHVMPGDQKRAADRFAALVEGGE